MSSSEHHRTHPRFSPWHLTKREVEILDAMCAVGSEKLIAQELGIEASTVHTHLTEIYGKFDKSHRVVVASLWTRWRSLNP